MKRRRNDLGLGLLAALALHGLLFAAAELVLRPGAQNVVPVPVRAAPLELRVLDESAWLAQLETSATARAAQPLEARVVHGQSAAPDWPQVSEPREPSFAAERRLPAARETSIAQPRDSVVARPRERLVATALAPREDDSSFELETPEPEAAKPGALDVQPVPLSAGSSLVIYRPELRYPERALRRAIEGTVRTAIEVAADGTVLRAWVIHSAGNRELDRSALRYMRGWRFDMQALRRRGVGRLYRSDVRFEIE